MFRTVTLVALLASTLSLPAIADDKKIIADPPGPAPTTIIVEQVPQTKPEAKSTSGAASAETIVQKSPSISLSEQEGKSWVDKPVYSSDGKHIGDVVAFQRDTQNNVIGMQADIGGFFGFGETRISLAPAQFTLQGDRAVLGLTAEQAKKLPPVQI